MAQVALSRSSRQRERISIHIKYFNCIKKDAEVMWSTGESNDRREIGKMRDRDIPQDSLPVTRVKGR
jgi:hypothetical protein